VQAGGVLVLARVAGGGGQDAVDACRRLAVEHLEVPGKGVGGDPGRQGQVARAGGQLGAVGPDRGRVA